MTTFAFAAAPQGAEVFFYNDDLSVRASTAPFDSVNEYADVLCVTRSGTVWVSYSNYAGPAFSILRELNVDDGSLIQEITLGILVANDQSLRSLHQLPNGDLLTFDGTTKAMIRIAIPSGAITTYGLIAVNYLSPFSAFDIAVNAAGDRVVYLSLNTVDQSVTAKVWDLVNDVAMCDLFVVPPPPVARFTFEFSGEQDILFDASTTTAQPDAVYTWDFGDGSGPFTGKVLDHQFPAGNHFRIESRSGHSVAWILATQYEIVLTVTDAGGTSVAQTNTWDRLGSGDHGGNLTYSQIRWTKDVLVNDPFYGDLPADYPAHSLFMHFNNPMDGGGAPDNPLSDWTRISWDYDAYLYAVAQGQDATGAWTAVGTLTDFGNTTIVTIPFVIS